MKRFPAARPYLVGGVVRDCLLKRPTKDIDYVIAGVSAKQLESYLRGQGQVDAVGKTFGVLKFRPRGVSVTDSVDVALPRTEHSLRHSGRYRDFVVKTDERLSILSDVRRRDFTMNAIAWDIRGRQLVDPTGGVADIAAQRIRAVGSPRQRFQEDYSRLLRALRFSVQLGFQIEDKTWRALLVLTSRLGSDRVPRETVARELLRSLAGDPVRTMDVFDRAGVWRVLVPELAATQGCRQERKYHAEGDVWTHTRLALERAGSPEFAREFGPRSTSLQLLVTLLLHDIGKPIVAKKNAKRSSFYGHELIGSQVAADICHRLKLSSHEGTVDADQVRWLISSHMLTLHEEPSRIDPLTVERVFLNPLRPGQTLLQMMYADQSASRTPGGRPSLRRYHATKKLIEKVRRRGFDRRGNPNTLLTGEDIMKTLAIPAGRVIGLLHDALRAEQLRGKISQRTQALRFIRQHYATHYRQRARG